MKIGTEKKEAKSRKRDSETVEKPPKKKAKMPKDETAKGKNYQTKSYKGG